MPILPSPRYARLEGALLVLTLGLTLPLARRLNAAPVETNLVIGLLLPPEEAEASSIREGVALAVEQANRGTAAEHVSVVTRGRQGQWGADAVEAARMATDDGVQGLIGPADGAATHLLLQVAGRTAVPVLSLCADSSVTQTGVRWMLRLVPSTIQEGRALLKELQDGRGGFSTRCVALIPNERAGREIAKDLKRAIEGSKFELEKVLMLQPATEDYDAVSRQVLESRAGVALVWLDPTPAGRLVKALRAAGFNGTLAGPGRLRSPDFVTSAGAASEGFMTAELALDSAGEAKWRDFQTAFRGRFGHQPAAMSVFSYDATAILIHILENHPVDAARAFPLSFSWPGASGRLSFDAEGNRDVEFRPAARRLTADRNVITEASEGNEQR